MQGMFSLWMLMKHDRGFTCVGANTRCSVQQIGKNKHAQPLNVMLHLNLTFPHGLQAYVPTRSKQSDIPILVGMCGSQPRYKNMPPAQSRK